MRPVMCDRNEKTAELRSQGFLTSDNCSQLVDIKHLPLSDFYDVQTKPFARYCLCYTKTNIIIIIIITYFYYYYVFFIFFSPFYCLYFY